MEESGKEAGGAPPPSGLGPRFRRRRQKPKTYRLVDDALAPYQQRAVLGTATVVVAVVVASLWGADLKDYSLASPLLIVLCFVVAAGVGLAIGLVVLNQGWSSYELIVSKKTLALKLRQRPDVLIRRSEILRVEEWPGMGLRVLTLNRDKVIYIPYGVFRFNEVKTHLSNWRVLEERKGKWPHERWPFATAVAGMVAGVVALIALIRAEERVVILPVGILLLGGLGWAEYAIQRNPHLDRRIKVLSWLGLAGLVPIAGKVIQALQR